MTREEAIELLKKAQKNDDPTPGMAASALQNLRAANLVYETHTTFEALLDDHEIKACSAMRPHAYEWTRHNYRQSRAALVAHVAGITKERDEWKDRRDLLRMKLDQSEAALAEARRVTDGWNPDMDAAPKDGANHLRGLWVTVQNPNTKQEAYRYFDVYAGYVEDETGEFVALNGDYIGWPTDEFTHWAPLAAAPKGET